jgi:glyoxylase-like metal-dependent hydrolase (beta-lactamase superfamily II)
VADLLELSARLIDEGITDEPANRVTTELSEVADGIAVIEAFSHVVVFRTDAGLVLFDTSLEMFAEGILKSLRAWTDAPVHTVVYTHGHVDHVGGARAILDESRGRSTTP